MNAKIKGLLAMSIFLISLTSCEKPEGYGGTSSIKGVMFTESYNDDYSQLISKVEVADEEVFLMFGDEDYLGDRVFTSISGAFEFPYLREGSYTLYYPSEDSASLSDDDAMQMIELQLKNGEVLDLGELIQLKTLDFDDGSAKISGIVKLINYKNSSVYPFLEIKDITFAQKEDVYLVYGDHVYYDENIETGQDGYFEFTNLIPGDYEIYVYSEDVAGGTEDIPIVKNVTISDTEQEISLDIITIEQL